MFTVFSYKFYDWGEKQSLYWKCYYTCEYPFMYSLGGQIFWDCIKSYSILDNQIWNVSMKSVV